MGSLFPYVIISYVIICVCHYLRILLFLYVTLYPFIAFPNIATYRNMSPNHPADIFRHIRTYSYVIICVCHYLRMSLFAYVIIYVCHYFLMSLFAYVIICVCHYLHMPLFAYVIISSLIDILTMSMEDDPSNDD